MPRTLEQWKAETAELSEEDRAALAEHLLESLEPPEADSDDSEWEAELNRRIEDLRSGREVGIPVEEVLADLKREFR